MKGFAVLWFYDGHGMYTIIIFTRNVFSLQSRETFYLLCIPILFIYIYDEIYLQFVVARVYQLFGLFE